VTNIYARAVRALGPVLGPPGLDYCCRPGCGHLACRVVHALDDADLIAYADVQAVRGALDDAEAADRVGQYVRAHSAADREETVMTGRVVGYNSAPTYLLDTGEGRPRAWRVDLTEPAEAPEEYDHSRAKEDRRNGLGEDGPPEDSAGVVEALVFALRLQRAAWQVVRVWESGVRQPPAPRLGRALRELHRALRGHEAKAVD